MGLEWTVRRPLVPSARMEDEEGGDVLSVKVDYVLLETGAGHVDDPDSMTQPRF